MRRVQLLPAILVIAACGSDVAGDRTAQIARENAAQRDSALESRIDNPTALACIRANASDEEWAILRSEHAAAPAVLQLVLNRERTRQCFSLNNVVIYI